MDQMMTVEALDRRIEITPGVAGGNPRIAGHRITVQNNALALLRSEPPCPYNALLDLAVPSLCLAMQFLRFVRL